MTIGVYHIGSNSGREKIPHGIERGRQNPQIRVARGRRNTCRLCLLPPSNPPLASWMGCAVPVRCACSKVEQSLCMAPGVLTRASAGSSKQQLTSFGEVLQLVDPPN